MASIAYEPIPAEGATTTTGQETTRSSHPLLGTEAGEAIAAADSEEKNSPSADVRGMEDDDRSFKVGELVMTRVKDHFLALGYSTPPPAGVQLSGLSQKVLTGRSCFGPVKFGANRVRDMFRTDSKPVLDEPRRS